MRRASRLSDRHRPRQNGPDAAFQHTPRKRFGQNFLTDRNILDKIVRAAEISRSDSVLEIGPGLGHLTRALAETGAQVAAVELDRDLFTNLCAEFSDITNVHLLQGDILERTPDEWLAQAQLAPPYLVVANIPYYITSPILRYLLEATFAPMRLVVLVQKEVAQHMVAQPPHANLLGVSIQYYGMPRIVGTVPAGAFFPRPEVDSAIVRVDVSNRHDATQARAFFQVVRAGFSGKRKQLRNALANGLHLSTAQATLLLQRAQVDPTRRAETLHLEEWKTLTAAAKLSNALSDDA